MAIDTRDKRASCVDLVAPNRARVWPNPSGSLATRGKRQQVAFAYAGVLTAPTGGGGGTQVMLMGVGQ